jgi:hypothetical protein
MAEDAGAPEQSLASRIYGREGPISGGPSDPRVRNIIESGRAQPSSLLSARPGQQQPGQRPAQQPSAAPGPTPAPSFDAGKLADAGDLDPGMLGQFADTAKELGLNQAGGQRLLDMHKEAVAARDQQFHQEITNWEQDTKQQFGPHLANVVEEVRGAIGEDADAQRFVQLLDWSGLGSNASVLRVLHRLARGGRY